MDELVAKTVRVLNGEEIAKLSLQDTRIVGDFKQSKLEKEAKKNWDLFYKRNETRFFKNRHWTSREFPELGIVSDAKTDIENRPILLEAGCGVGNLVFPLIEANTPYFIYSCDFSSKAIDLVKDNPLYNENRLKAFQCDLVNDSIESEIRMESVDVITLMFVLSAIHPDKMSKVIVNLHKVLKPGGLVLFRDYGIYDHAMIRFSPGCKLSENFYVRQDGTRAYYFSLEFLENLFTDSDFEVVENSYVNRKTENFKDGLSVPRIFVQAKFKKKLK